MVHTVFKPATKQVQALADISRSTLYAFAEYKAIILAYILVCCHSNETCAKIANMLTSAQLDGTPTIPLLLHPGPCSSLGMQ